MDDLENFRVNVRRFLAVEGLSQAALARKAEITPVHLNRVLHGSVDPSLAMCSKIAKGLGVSLSLLVGDPERIFQRTA